MRGARGAPLLAISLLALVPSQAARADPGRLAVVVVVDGLTVDRAVRAPLFRGLAAAGGLGLLAGGDEPLRPRDILAVGGERPSGRRTMRHGDPAAAAREIRRLLRTSSSDDVLVLVTSSGVEKGVGVRPLLLARGAPGDLLRAGGPIGGLTSDTTRIEGVVAVTDLVPTVLTFLGEPPPRTEPGSPIRIAGEDPTALYRRFVEYRRVVVPVGVVSLAVALGALAIGLVLLFGPWRPPAWVARGAAAGGLFGVSLSVAMLPASWLPSFHPAVVWPVLGALGGLIAVLATVLGRRRLVGPVVAVAALGLAAVVADALVGWPSLLTPLLGGGALDGVRFFGLGNPYAGMVLAGVVLLAAMVAPRAGVALIAAAGLFAGLPFLGADLGGALTLFAAAALWYGLRSRGRIGLREVGLVAGALVAGLAVVVVTHRLWPVSEHVFRATAAGPVGAITAFGDRLALNGELTARTPAVWPALALLPVGTVIAWRSLGPFGPPLRRDPAWRHAVVLLGVGGVLGWLLNDTFGMAAVAFIFLAAALVYPALADRWTSR